MRISTNTLFDSNVTQLNTLQNNLLQTQQQISTGRRILTPADDPAAAAQVLQVTQIQATNTQYISNAGATNDAVTLAEGALQGVNSLLNSIQTAAVSAGNAALSDADRKSLAATLQTSLTQLIGMANTKDAIGNYLFSGFKGATQPFVQTPTGVQYNGDDGQLMMQVSSNQQVAASDSGANIFMRIKNGNGSYVAAPVNYGTNIMPAATAATVPISFSATPATFTVDGTNVTVNKDVTVPGNGTGPGTLAAAIQAGMTAAGLSSYTVSSAATGGIQITHTGSTTAVSIASVVDPSNNIVAGAGTPANSGSGIISPINMSNPAPTTAQAGNSYQVAFTASYGTNIMPGATAATVPISFSTTPATFTVDGTNITLNQNVTVPGTGTGPGTLAAAIQSGLAAAGLVNYTVTSAAAGGIQITHTGSTAAVAITNAADPSGNIVNGAGASGTGVSYSITGIDSTGAALPTATQPGALPTAIAYTSGQSISFNGIQFDVQGTPANGDTFSITPSTNESVFATITNLITTLGIPVNPNNPASQALLTAGINHALDGLNNAMSNVLTAQASQGARMNQLTALTTSGNNLNVQYKQTISNLQDVDYNKAVSDLTQQKTILSAAQQSFVQIENLSMFNYMR